MESYPIKRSELSATSVQNLLYLSPTIRCLMTGLDIFPLKIDTNLSMVIMSPPSSLGRGMLSSRLEANSNKGGRGGGGVTPIDPVLLPVTWVKILDRLF